CLPIRCCLLHIQYGGRGGIILLFAQTLHQPRNPIESGTPDWSSCHAVRTGCWRHRTFPDSPCGAAGGPASSVPRSLHSLEETPTVGMEETPRVETRLV